MTVEFFWKTLLLGREGEYRESLFLRLLILKCLHVKIILMLQWHILDSFTVPIKLYFQKQVVGWFWPAGCSLLTPDGRALLVGQRNMLFTLTHIKA